MSGISGVELSEGGGWDTLQHLLGEDTEQLPANVQRFKYGPVLVAALCDEGLLKLGEELQVEKIIRGKSLLTNNSLHGLHILTNGITGIELIRYIRVILPSHTLTNS